MATPSLSPIAAAVAANVDVLRQGAALLAEIGGARYGARQPLCFDASIGGHLRHIIDHYGSFLSGVAEGEIDYEHRPRDPGLERDPGCAAARLREIAEGLRELAATANRELFLCAETAPGIATTTTVLRELEFLLSHTIHHYALVAVMARLQGVEPPAEFGVAPSTLRFQGRCAVASCAR